MKHLILLLLMVTGLVMAQTTTESSGDAQGAQHRGEHSKDQEQPSQDKSPSRYKPSEEISEDTPVPFPVDI